MHTLLKNKYILDVLTTIMFFTRIPINWAYFSNKPPDLTKAAWAFPIAGFLIGFLSGLVGDIFIYVGLPIFLSCTISILISVILTGALHEDGLADSADGLGASGTPRQINKIIRDSRLGTYGVSSLVLGIILRLGLMMTLVEKGYSLVSILCIGFSSGKVAIIFARNFFSNSNFAKVGSIMGEISLKKLLIALFIWLFPTLLIFSFDGILLGIFFMILVAMVVGKKSEKAIGGLTGDILGAIAFLAELSFLLGIVTLTSTLG